MAELPPSDRLQPCLLDRLTDDAPAGRAQGRDGRVVSASRYRQSVREHIQWLLNTSRTMDAEHVEAFPLAARSVLNFGLPDLCGMVHSQVNLADLRGHIVQALLAFEPRIDPASLAVEVVEGSAESPNAVTFEIRGQLWANPAPEFLCIETRIDLETGRCSLGEGGHG